ncbi:MAG: polysaccharide deacetylase family protein [Acidobacteria bacterium]|nr:polysaccharide deacetylase family protein [Acidobacteriota bacterium]
MSQRALERGSSTGAASRYLERLSKALPGPRIWRGAREFWPDGAKLVISVSLQFEAGAQPGGAPRVDSRYPDLPIKSSDYGSREGIPRLLEIFQRRRVHGTCHMAGSAVAGNPPLAKEIVERGHEPAAHGQAWAAQYSVTADEERASYEANIESIERATGVRPVGFNGFWRHSTAQTLEILQDLSFIYHVDDASRDEPSLVLVRGKPIAIVPYTLELNDFVAYEIRHYSTEQYAAELKNEFEMLYSEAETRRRMMSISAHGRIAGRPARAKVLEEFIIYAQRRPGVVFMRKDEIARFALASSITPRQEQAALEADAA